VWKEGGGIVDSEGRNAFMARQRQSRFESTVSKNDPETLLRRSLAEPDLLLTTAASTAAPRQKKTSLESIMCALGLPRSRANHLLFPKIRSGELDLDAEPFARGSSRNVFRARLRKTVPSVGPPGHLVAVLQEWKKKNILDTELEVFARIGNHPFLTRLVAVMPSDSQDGTLLVTEFAELGSLDKVLTNLTEKREKASTEVLLRAALQVLEGMVWLQKKKILHRDLALRNLLVFSFDTQNADKVLVKITDYGQPGSPSMFLVSIFFYCLLLVL
jgi:serine/threonine protein kinase